MRSRPEDFDGIVAGQPVIGTLVQSGRAPAYQLRLAHLEHCRCETS